MWGSGSDLEQVAEQCWPTVNGPPLRYSIDQATMMANDGVEDEEEVSSEQIRIKTRRSWSVDVKKREAAMETVLPVVADSYRDIIKMVTLASIWIMKCIWLWAFITINLLKCVPSGARELSIPFPILLALSTVKIYMSQFHQVGEDPNREGLLETPMRAAKAITFFTKGYQETVQEVVKVTWTV